MTFLFDIDGTICTTRGTDYAKADPNVGMLDIIRELHAAGHTIYFFTARGFMGGAIPGQDGAADDAKTVGKLGCAVRWCILQAGGRPSGR